MRSTAAAADRHDWTTMHGRMAWLTFTLFNGSCSAMAREIGLSHTIVNQVVKGKRLPGRAFIATIVRCLTVNEAWLRTGKGEPFVANVIKDEADILKKQSGTVANVSPLVSFLYELMRDHLPTGTIERIKCNSLQPGTTEYTNGYLANYAAQVAARLTGGDHKTEPRKE